MSQLNLFGDDKGTRYITCPVCRGTGVEPWVALGDYISRVCHCCKGAKRIKEEFRFK